MEKFLNWFRTPQVHAGIGTLLQLAGLFFPQYLSVLQSLSIAFGFSSASLAHPDTAVLSAFAKTGNDAVAQIRELADKVKSLKG
jgi:hypothetical protein